MHYNPFARNIKIEGYDSYEDEAYSIEPMMFDRMLGTDEIMGVLDYLLILPYIYKRVWDSLAIKSNFATNVYNAFSYTGNVIKFLLFVAASPLVFILWCIREIAVLFIEKKETSTFKKELNNLSVIPEITNNRNPLLTDSGDQLNLSEALNRNFLGLISRNNKIIIAENRYESSDVANVPATSANIVSLRKLIDITQRTNSYEITRLFFTPVLAVKKYLNVIKGKVSNG